MTLAYHFNETESLYRALLESASGFALLILAPNRRIIARNRGAMQIVGECDAYGGAPASEVDRELAAAREWARCAHERWYVRDDGTRFWADIVLTAIHEGGTLAYYVANIRDLTLHKKALEEVHERSLENAAVAAFAHKAVTERRPDELDRAARAYLAAALQTNQVELWRSDDSNFVSGGIYVEAMERLAPVTRRLTEDDFAVAPYLRGYAEYGIATAVECGDSISVVAAFSDHRPFEAQSIYPLQAIAAMHAAAIIRCAAEAEIRETESALRKSREQLRKLTAATNQVQENERRRIAREVHDELGQRLTALRLDLGLLRAELRDARTAPAERRIATMFDLIDETIATVRRVATELRPAILDDFGFRAAIEHEISAFAKRTGIDVTLSFRPDDIEIDSTRGTALYRIVQEALTNVARHSGATRAVCSIEQRDGNIHAVVRDNGRGITEQESLSRLGLIGLRERAYALGGDATIEGTVGVGTIISVWIPYEDTDRR